MSNSKSESKSTNTKPVSRKRKRAQRNKERLLNHQSKLLDNFATGVTQGYSDERWSGLVKLYNQVSEFITPDERRELGFFWSETYAGDVNTEGLARSVELVKARLLSSLG